MRNSKLKILICCFLGHQYDDGSQYRTWQRCHRCHFLQRVKDKPFVRFLPIVEESVVEKIRERRELGLVKYGVGMERTDLSRLEWLRHAQAEAMDLAVYLEKLIQEEQQ